MDERGEIKTIELNPEELAISEISIRDILCEIDEIDSQISENKENGEKAKEKANIVETGFLKGRKAVKELKEVSMMNADANIKTLEIVNKVSDNQTKMANACAALIALGSVSIAQNRAIISSIKAKLRDGEDKELSEETKARLIEVIRELNQKRDFLQKLEDQGAKINELNQRVLALESVVDESKKSEIVLTRRIERMVFWLRVAVGAGLVAVLLSIICLVIML